MLVGGFRANIPNFAHRPREIWITIPAFMFEFVVPLVLYDRQCSVSEGSQLFVLIAGHSVGCV